MAYPVGTPSSGIANIWEGTFTPSHIVGAIIDDVTPVNKNNMRLSVGKQVSLIQNFVNSNLLARADTPINSGYINDLIIFNKVYSSGEYAYSFYNRDGQFLLNISGLYCKIVDTGWSGDEYEAYYTAENMRVLEAIPGYQISVSSRFVIHTAPGALTYYSYNFIAPRSDFEINNKSYLKNITFAASNIIINGPLMPYVSITEDMGSSSNKWRYFYASGVRDLDQLDFNVTTITIPNATTTYSLDTINSSYRFDNANDVKATVTLSAYNNGTQNQLLSIGAKVDVSYTGELAIDGLYDGSTVTILPGQVALFMHDGKSLNIYPVYSPVN